MLHGFISAELYTSILAENLATYDWNSFLKCIQQEILNQEHSAVWEDSSPSHPNPTKCFATFSILGMRVFLLISSFPSQTNNQVHRSPKCFYPLLTLSSELRLQPACLKLASCALTSWLWRPSWDSQTGNNPTANKWGNTFGEGIEPGKWPRFNSQLPVALPGTAAGEGQILCRSKLVLLLGVP